MFVFSHFCLGDHNGEVCEPHLEQHYSEDKDLCAIFPSVGPVSTIFGTVESVLSFVNKILICGERI